MMLKTLLITLDFWPKIGGVASYYFNLCQNLDKDKIVVLTQKESIIENQELRDFNFKIYRNKLLWNFIWPKWLPMFWYIFKIIKREKLELIWVGEILPTGTAVWLLNKLIKKPYVVSCHGNDILQAGKFERKKKLAKRILQSAKYVTVNSQYTKGLAQEMGVEEDKIKLVYPGIKVKSPASPAGRQKSPASPSEAGRTKVKSREELLSKYDLKDKKILLSVGRLVERKGFDKVIESLPKVWQSIPNVVYVIAGDGADAERLKGLAKDKRIKFLGRVSDKDKWALMEICDVFIMVAREDKDDVEGFGIVYLEAASCAKPVIAGNVGGAKEAVVNGQTGRLINPESTNETSQAILELFKNKELARKLGERGKKRVKESFGWDRAVEDLREVLE